MAAVVSSSQRAPTRLSGSIALLHAPCAALARTRAASIHSMNSDLVLHSQLSCALAAAAAVTGARISSVAVCMLLPAAMLRGDQPLSGCRTRGRNSGRLLRALPQARETEPITRWNDTQACNGPPSRKCGTSVYAVLGAPGATHPTEHLASASKFGATTPRQGRKRND